MALAVHPTPEGSRDPALDRLAQDQMADGSVAVCLEAPTAYWVTPLAILAWRASGAHTASLERAADFLCRTSGRHWKANPSSPTSHDPSIRGWAWNAGTHSWVTPTAFAILALRSAGRGADIRVEEAVRMLLDRQLDTGGWNYGNTYVYGTRLQPQPDQTGLALLALREYVTAQQVTLSLAYLRGELGRLATPLSLGWALMGLEAWQERSDAAADRVAACVRRCAPLAGLTTQELSVLLMSEATDRRVW